MNKTPAPEAPVSFLDPDPNEIYLGQTRLRDHLKATGVKDAQVVREVLRGLDFTAFEARYKSGGRPPFAPVSMIGIVLYGLMHGVSSLRELERFARLDLGCMWVSGGNMPDHSVLGRFISKHEQELSALLFEQVVRAVLAKTRSSSQSLAGDATGIGFLGTSTPVTTELSLCFTLRNAEPTREGTKHMNATRTANLVTCCIEFAEMNGIYLINLIDAVKLACHVPGSAKFIRLRTDLPKRCYWVEFETEPGK